MLTVEEYTTLLQLRIMSHPRALEFKEASLKIMTSDQVCDSVNQAAVTYHSLDTSITDAVEEIITSGIRLGNTPSELDFQEFSKAVIEGITAHPRRKLFTHVISSVSKERYLASMEFILEDLFYRGMTVKVTVEHLITAASIAILESYNKKQKVVE